MAFIEPLDLQTILIDLFSGSIEIFAIIALLSISVAAAFFRLPGHIYIVMVVAFVAIMSAGGIAVGYFQGIFYLISIILFIVVAYFIARWLPR